jgi:hypothetical protein
MILYSRSLKAEWTSRNDASEAEADWIGWTIQPVECIRPQQDGRAVEYMHLERLGTSAAEMRWRAPECALYLMPYS